MTLGKEGLDFFRSFLKNGSYLGRAASQLIQPGDEVVTWLPDGVDIASVSLKEGFGQGEAPVLSDLWTPLEHLTREFLGESPHHMAIVEAEYAYPPERLAELIRAANQFHDFAYFTCDSVVDKTAAKAENGRRLDVFGYLTGSDLSAEHVSDFIEQAAPYHQIIALTSSEASGRVESGSQVEKEYLTRLALTAKHLAIGAYDGMGVVLWTRPEVKAHGLT
jgi:hypothetical protein